ncbi:hypothetical protein [Microbispora triticiradicis]|uniref:hypothetical protein n=1 Tax=Microbispora triticiradicis TaxID=2200763 RepID=UPI001AD633BB|nr:hypothetical protein [Microbispora triticiradicis]MBO4271539.1 hypothetical protein [Microbispora triticiradicis]
MTVAGGLTLGIPAAAAARTVMSPVAPAGDDTARSPEPVAVENAEEPGEDVDVSPVVQENGPGTAAQQPVCTGNACSDNGGVWNRNAGGWSYPLAYTYNDTKTINAQPIAAPAGAGTGRGAGPSVTGVGPAIGPGTGAGAGAGAGGAGIAPLQNATQSAEQWPVKGPVKGPAEAPVGAGGASAVEGEPEELPGETTDEEGLPGEETDDEESPEKDTTDEAETDEADEDEADEADEAPAGMAPEEMAGPAPVAAAGPAAGPAGGAQLPFTGAPVNVAAAGAGLLAVALGCTLATARRRRSTHAG